MSDTSGTDAIRSEYISGLRRRRIIGALEIAAFVAALAWGFGFANDANSGPFLQGVLKIFDFPAELIGEAWEKRAEIPGEVLGYLPALVETLNIAAFATLVGSIFGGLLALLSAHSLAPWPRLVPVFRRAMDISRAFPEIVVALVLIYLLGGGPLPAAIAISIHSVGALGKLFSEVVENVDTRPVEGLASVGATWLEKMLLAVLPQVLPNWTSYLLLRFEINIRASAILGFVGAGGIGTELRTAISWGIGRYDHAAAVFILLILTIGIVDQGSSVLRNRLVRGARP